MVVGISLLPRLLLGQVFEQFRIVDPGGDHIAAAGPLTQIDGAAAVAAEREVLAGPKHKGAADGTTQRNWLFLWHTQLDAGRKPTIFYSTIRLANHARHQVVIMRLGNLATIEAARNQFLVIAKIIDK